ncbi:MAG: phenylacetic acid degradation protein [Deinococcales bacterium]|jgi:ring-1,2-phenylacetyl-CoA epoxidase subunit PaaB
MATAPTPSGEGPRWEVFKQDTPSKPHQAVGSVHAADPEHALLMARSVYARRPAAVSLWVAPAEAVFAVTAEELAAAEPWSVEEAGEERLYQVFRKTSHRRAMTFVDHVGEVSAPGPRAAVAAARQAFPEPPALAWWVVPTARLSASPDDEAAAWFEPAADKTYKQQSAYGLLAPKKPGRSKGGDR